MESRSPRELTDKSPLIRATILLRGYAVSSSARTLELGLGDFGILDFPQYLMPLHVSKVKRALARQLTQTELLQGNRYQFGYPRRYRPMQRARDSYTRACQ